MQQVCKMEVTAVFDIGKTNKKFFLFDKNYQEVFKSYQQFEEIEDDDGFPCDDVLAIQNWITTTFQEALKKREFNIRAVNCSAYGASFVHIDKDGRTVAPLYNYLKPFPEDLLSSFYNKYGEVIEMTTSTASPSLGMLNSGLQLYWLKYTKPKLFEKIRWSLHLPQYLSFLFSGIPLSDYTSIGCHTMLWDYEKSDYHHWVYAEGIDRILPPIVTTNTSINRRIKGKEIKIGVGIHDSSAALLPYKMVSHDPFLLLSTGTWSIALNPFNQELLTSEELNRDCLNYLTVDGKMIKASRLFLGNEYKIWIRHLADFFNQPLDKHKSTKPDVSVLEQLDAFPKYMFRWESLASENTDLTTTDLSQFPDYETAYHKLMQELAGLQIEALYLAKGNANLNKIFIDGGFIDNELFIHFLSGSLSQFEWVATQTPLGSAVGAAIVMDDPQIVSNLLTKHFNLRH